MASVELRIKSEEREAGLSLGNLTEAEAKNIYQQLHVLMLRLDKERQ